MKYYDNLDNHHERIHTVQITLQSGEYIGHIAYEVGGNCFGVNLLEPPFESHGQDDIEKYVINDCIFAYHEKDDSFTATLKNSAGDGCEHEWDIHDLYNCVVAIELIDCVKKL